MAPLRVHDPLVDLDYTNSNLESFQRLRQRFFIGGQNGYPPGDSCMPIHTNFDPRLAWAQNFPRLAWWPTSLYGIFYTPVDMNTWCNQRHNVPYVFPETAQSDPYISLDHHADFLRPYSANAVSSPRSSCMRRRSTSSSGAPRLKNNWEPKPRSKLVTSALAASTCQRSHLDQQRAAGAGPDSTPPAVSQNQFCRQHGVPAAVAKHNDQFDIFGNHH